MNVLVAIYSPFTSWGIPDRLVDRLRAEFPEHTFLHARNDSETSGAIADVDVAFSSQIKPAHVAGARRLHWVHSPAAGVAAMLFPEMIASNITLTNSRGISAVTIAEHTIAVCLVLLRNLRLAWERQAERRWAQDEFNSGDKLRTLRGAEVLIVGLGAIGTETARRMAAFGARVTAVRRRIDLPIPAGVQAVVPSSDLVHHLPQADIVVIAAPQTRETTHLIGAAELAAVKPDALLVNVSRGKLVDEAALVAALSDGHLGGAALDVFEHEPLAPDSPLWGRPDVLITPHVSGFYRNYWSDATALFAQNLRRFGSGEPLLNVVDKQAGY